MKAQQVIEAALSDDDLQYLEVERPVTAQTAQYLDQVAERFPASHSGTTFLTVAGKQYRREGDTWVRINRMRNKAYWEKPSYFVIFGTMHGKWTMIHCKIPRTATQVAFRRAIKAIARDYTGQVVPWENIQVEGTDEKIWEKRASGTVNEPAYAIDGSGQFTRVDRSRRKK